MPIMKSTIVKVPPIKTQGIKTKLVGFISSSIKWPGNGKWIEPFLGSGVVMFNINPKKALGAELNVHIVRLYKSIQKGTVNRKNVKKFLEVEGARLEKDGDSYYYEVRDRFNDSHEPLDFLFLNRSCFNGLMRFNSKGRFNVPFCRKPQRFSKAYITKISNQVAWAESIISGCSDWKFEAADWRESVECAKRGDFLYLDPPYYGRHANYYDVWDKQDMDELADKLHGIKCGFALSLWYENRYRKNEDIKKYFTGFKIRKYEHFYHIGSTESLRNSMTEVLIMNKE